MATETRTAEATEEALWPNLTRAAAMFELSVPQMSRLADAAGLGTWVRGEKRLRPRDLLSLAERHGESLYDIASDLFDYARETAAPVELSPRLRAEINGFLADYQRRRDPARVLSQAEFVEELRVVLSPAEFEKARARLLAQPHPAADMFSADRDPSA